MSESPALTDISGDYTLDTAHSRLGFVARHAVVTKVRGQFTDWTATAHIDTTNPAASSVTLTINPASVSTGS
ncbi:YceI family protein, partial [Pimelobacter sp. 30-1]|uniref:YceI family protein n=1 Tax=Pimelobacter sp. 30-1 TaxID=2004991 RepID=UPI001C049E1C